MWPTHWLDRVRLRSTSGQRPRRDGYRPRLESLEDRIAPAAHIWNGNSHSDNNWSDPANWSAGGAPSTSESSIELIFPASGVSNVATTDDIQLLKVSIILFQADGYLVQAPSSGPIILVLAPPAGATGAVGTIDNQVGTNTFTSQVQITPQGSNGALFQVEHGTLDIQGPINSPSSNLTVVGPGTVERDGTSNVNLTDVANGTLAVSSGAALGGALELDNLATLKAVGGPVTVGVPVTLSGTAGVGGTNALTFSSGIGGSGTFSVLDPGGVTLDGTDTYGGGTLLYAGRVVLGQAAAIPGTTSVGISGFASLDLNNLAVHIGSLYGAGAVYLGSGTLFTGGDNTSTLWTGDIGPTGAPTAATGGVVKQGTGTFTLDGFGKYLGPTEIQAGTLALASSTALPVNAAVTVDAAGTLDLAGNNLALGSLSGTGTVLLHGATLAVGTDNSDTTWGGSIGPAGDPGGLTKVGGGTMTLSGTNSHAGTTTIQGGTLEWGSNTALSDVTPVVLVPGLTLQTLRVDVGVFCSVGSLAGDGVVDLFHAGLAMGDDGLSTTFAGFISGGLLAKSGSGTFTLTGIDDAVETDATGGTFRVGSQSAAVGSNTLVVDPGATFDLNDTQQAISVVGNAGTVSLGSGTLITGPTPITGSEAVFSTGTFTGTGRLIKTGTAIAVLEGNSPFSGLTADTLGTLEIDGTQPNSPVNVGVVANLSGDGMTGPIVVSGNVSPGGHFVFPATTTLTTAGDATFLPGSSLTIFLNGTTPGSGYSQLNVAGKADLTGGPTLNLSLGFTSSLSDTFTILKAAGGVTGTFAGMPDGATFTVNGTPLEIHYTPTSVVVTHVLPANHFGISVPAGATAGTPFSFTLTALDANNFPVHSYAGTVHFTSSDGQAVLPADYPFAAADAGTHTFTATLKTAGPQTITATDAADSVTTTSGTVAVAPAAASRFAVAGFPSPTPANLAGPFAVTAYDPYGNVATGYRGTVHFTSSDGSAVLPADYPFVAADNGSRSFSATFRSFGTQSLTATDTTTGSVTGSQTGIQVVQPAAGVSGPSVAVRGQTLTFVLSASEPRVPPDTAFTFLIHWADGTPDTTVTGPSGTTVQHVYADTLSGQDIAVTATDPYGNVSPPALLPFVIEAAALLPDPVNPSQQDLVIGGTPGNDTIVVTPADAAGDLTVTINSVGVGTFLPTGHILAYGYAGNDTIRLQSANFKGTRVTVAAPAVLVAGSGHDTLDASGSSANNVLIGGSGIDQLTAGAGRDILIAGTGGSTLQGGSGEDILIGGTTDFDSNLAALYAIQAQWGRTDAGEDFATRVAQLSGSQSGGLNGAYLLNASTVHDSGASDTLACGGGNDWLFAQVTGSNPDVIVSSKTKGQTTLVTDI